MRRAAVALILVSCTFPGVTYSDASVDSGEPDVTVQPDGGETDAGDAGDGAVVDPCDQDHDGYRAKGTCGGTDCDDHDPRVHPDAGFVDDVPDGATMGDWDCNGTVELEYPNVISACTLSCGAQGFGSTTGCGVVNWLIQCTSNTPCSKTDAGLHPQGCM